MPACRLASRIASIHLVSTFIVSRSAVRGFRWPPYLRASLDAQVWIWARRRAKHCETGFQMLHLSLETTSEVLHEATRASRPCTLAGSHDRTDSSVGRF